jgi:hypothetical protein
MCYIFTIDEWNEECHVSYRVETNSDEDIHTTDTSMPIQVPISGPITSGPIIRARARQLNHQVITLLNACPSYLDHGDPCTLVLLRNQGEDRKGTCWIRTAEEHQLVTVTTVTCGLGLECSSTTWKAYQVYFHMDLGL